MTLKEFFTKNNKLAIALSGGIDSSFLLYSAVQNGADVLPVFVRTEFQPEFEERDAQNFARELGVNLHVVKLSVLEDKKIVQNDHLRCYYCKKKILSAVADEAEKHGFTIIADGTNASDKADERPGTAAQKELHVISPLRECGITKDEIRTQARKCGIYLWNKPAYACLATRIPYGRAITPELLCKIEKAENALVKLGFSDFRVRVRAERLPRGDAALLQVTEQDFCKLCKMREAVKNTLNTYFSEAFIDMETRK